MFNPRTEKIKTLSEQLPKAIQELEQIFDAPTNVYIDFANVLGWQNKLKWHIDLKRLKQLFDSFNNINAVKLYNGTLEDDPKSQNFIKWIEQCGYTVKTKPVKIIRLSINTSSIPLNSPALLENFICKPLLSKLSLEVIEYLNKELKTLNDKGVFYIENKKCNFDVEIGRDMLRDYDKNNIQNFILWSGDSDFESPVNQLLKDNKKVMIFIVSGRLSAELSQTKAHIFDIRKIKEFICWPRELKAKGTLKESP